MIILFCLAKILVISEKVIFLVKSIINTVLVCTGNEEITCPWCINDACQLKESIFRGQARAHVTFLNVNNCILLCQKSLTGESLRSSVQADWIHRSKSSRGRSKRSLDPCGDLEPDSTAPDTAGVSRLNGETVRKRKRADSPSVSLARSFSPLDLFLASREAGDHREGVGETEIPRIPNRVNKAESR